LVREIGRRLARDASRPIIFYARDLLATARQGRRGR
jgi:hypothetical protein